MADQVIEQSVEDRMLAFLDVEEPAVEEPIAEVQEEEQPEATETEETTEEEQEAERVLKLKHDGVEIEKPESEVITLAQQGFDYTQKTQKLAEDRKVVEAMAQTIKDQEVAFRKQVEMQSALINEIADVTAIDKQLSQYQNLNWQQLSDSDPVEAQKLFFAYNQLQVQRGQAVAAINTKKQELSKAQEDALNKHLELGRQTLEKEIPGWNSDMAKDIAATGREYGFSNDELSKLTDPRAVKLLHDAAQWRKLQASRPTVDKKVATASPTVKPGAKNSATVDRSRTAQAREQLRKTGNGDIAAKLIERML